LRATIAADGFRGLFRGVVPVTLKQGSNALVRFTSYTTILDAVKPLMRNSSSAPAIAGAMAGAVTVYATMPFDVVKTKMQALDGRQNYRSTWHCFSSILQTSGITAFWKGTTPRLVRLSVRNLSSQ
jgi:solute carrier family 25 citrate transporter 1